MSDHEVIEQTETHRVILIHDDDPEGINPRHDYTNLGIMWARHRDCCLGDDPGRPSSSPPEEHSDLSAFIDEVAPWAPTFADLNRAIVRHLVRKHGATVVLPLYLYDHSGLSMSAGSDLVTSGEYGKRQGGRDHFAFDPGGWDTSYVGFIFDTQRTREECGTALDQIEDSLRNEVREYDSYLRGDVWGYRIERKTFVTTVVQRERGGEVLRTSNSEEWEVVDDCWGFIGHDNAIASAREAFADYREKGAA